MEAEMKDDAWKSFYRIGGTAALLAVMVGLIEIAISFLPGGSTSPETVIDWFVLFHDHWFLGLRDLGLLNIFIVALGLLIFFALYGAHRQVNKTGSAFALLMALLGAAVFYATNRAFSMLDLSHQYAAASTADQRMVLAAAGQAMLSVGKSHTPGTFMAFILSEIAGILMSVVMLKGKVFGRITAIVGILAFTGLLFFEICSSFMPALSNVIMLIAMVAGLLSLAWYLLVARRFFQIARSVS
jgi:Domain of unknown function (DUF4386)